MKFFVKTIALFSALTFAGCQLVRDSDGFYTIERRKTDDDNEKMQQRQSDVNTDNTTISIKDTHRQEADTKNVDINKYIAEPANGGMVNKDDAEKKMEEAIRLASNETKQKNRFVVDTNNENVETKQECNCKCENNNNPAIQQEYTQEAQDVRQDNKVLYIQVGVYSNFDNANAFAEKLRRNGISNVRLIDERGRVKVVIGGFETKSSGKTTINKLYDIGIYDYFWKEIR